MLKFMLLVNSNVYFAIYNMGVKLTHMACRGVQLMLAVLVLTHGPRDNFTRLWLESYAVLIDENSVDIES